MSATLISRYFGYASDFLDTKSHLIWDLTPKKEEYLLMRLEIRQ